MMTMDGFSGAWFNQSSRLVPLVEVARQSYLSQFYTVSPESAKTFTSLCHEQTPTEQILLLDLPYKWILVAQKMQNSFNNFLFNGVHLYTILSQPMNPKKVQGWTLDRQLRTANGLSDEISGSMFFIHLSCIYFDFFQKESLLSKVLV